jgi:uncharacterized protein (DUF58 family)
MFTARARWLVVIALAAAGAGLLNELHGLTRAGLAILLWVGVSWFWFRLRCDQLAGRVRAERTLWMDRGPARTLWAGRAVEVRARVTIPDWLRLPYVAVRDRLPAGVEPVAGLPEAGGALGWGQALDVAYTFRPQAVGSVRFEGLTLRLADLQGFFYLERFVPLVQVLRVLPPLLEGEPGPTQVKRFNLLPPPGRHRHRRPGIGSELLELRDYVPGDPFRSIAWKVTARRDRLMTKEYETEVPVRCTLFVDVSSSVRVGYPGPTPLSHLAQLAATLAQTAVANRDPVALCLFDERGSQTSAAAANNRHVIRLVNQLAEAAGRPPAPVDCPLEPLLAQAAQFCREVVPEAFRPSVNRVPFSLIPLRPSRRRVRRQRIQLATFLAEYFDLSLGEPVRLMYDDARMTELLQRFLADHHVAYDGPLYDRQGRYLFAAPGKVRVLTRALTRAVRKEHDNELYVILADLLELRDRLGPLLGAVRVALSRHHRVVVLCAWPPGLPPPRSAREPPPDFAAGPRPLAQVVREADLYRFTNAFHELRGLLGPLRVPVLCATEGRPARLLLAELEQLRVGGRR